MAISFSFFQSSVGSTRASHWGQTVLLHRGIISWLKCNCIITATRPVILKAAGRQVRDLQK